MKTLATLSLMIFPMFLSATTYTSLKDGAWSNATDVWSTDGITACSCTPPYILSGDTIVIKHNISLASNIEVKDGSYITIEPSKTLNASSCEVSLINGDLISDGTTQIKKLTIDASSSVEINDASLQIAYRVEVYGSLLINASVLQVDSGNVLIYSTGLFDLDNTSKLYFITGNFSNYGSTSICADCCLEISSGNIRNYASGSVTGSGSIISASGNIRNDNVWGMAIKWCSAGADTGMPSAEDCTGADAVCSAFILLPVELSSFEVTSEDNYNHIEWITASEINCDYFDIMKSVDGEAWTKIGSVFGNGNSQEEIYYDFRDAEISGTITYYQLIQHDFDGKKNYSKVISVVNKNQAGACVYPNPGQDNFSILFGDQKVESITIVDVNGAVVYKEKVNPCLNHMNITTNLGSGVYYLNLLGSENVNTISLFVQK